ncbi:MAG TPA: hypothetical protein DCG49_03375 [Ruminococcus sp.]|nr:hypothetical protein [Ruminococcus sp.]
MPEYLDLYYADQQKTGQRIVRGEPIPDGCYIMLVSILTRRPDGKILITRRAPEKKYAGRWEITGGCVQAGESPCEGAVRELREETGISAQTADLVPCGTEMRKYFVHNFFLLDLQSDITAVSLQKGETDAAKWVYPAEYLAIYQQDQAVSHHIPLLMRHYPDIFSESKMQRSMQ